MPANLHFALEWLPRWAAEHSLQAEQPGDDRLLLFDADRRLDLSLVAEDVFAYIRSAPAPADLLIAHAFLDLLPLPDSLPGLFSLLKPGGLAWLTVNFDGLTHFEPPFDTELDANIERLYHASMDTRPSGGDSQTGRHLFGYLQAAGLELLASGGSDWLVYPLEGTYPADEAYFLNYLLTFFEDSLTGNPELDPGAFSRWLAERRRQVQRAELVFIAHHLDFLVRKSVAKPPVQK